MAIRPYIIPNPQYIRADVVGGIDPLARPTPRVIMIDDTPERERASRDIVITEAPKPWLGNPVVIR